MGKRDIKQDENISNRYYGRGARERRGRGPKRDTATSYKYRYPVRRTRGRVRRHRAWVATLDGASVWEGNPAIATAKGGQEMLDVSDGARCLATSCGRDMTITGSRLVR